MLALYVLVVGAVVGAIASRGNPRLALLYVPVAFLGALLGAFAAFGDAPFLLRYRFINPFHWHCWGLHCLLAVCGAVCGYGGGVIPRAADLHAPALRDSSQAHNMAYISIRDSLAETHTQLRQDTVRLLALAGSH